jgi:hypothetical protein
MISEVLQVFGLGYCNRYPKQCRTERSTPVTATLIEGGGAVIPATSLFPGNRKRIVHIVKYSVQMPKSKSLWKEYFYTYVGVIGRKCLFFIKDTHIIYTNNLFSIKDGELYGTCPLAS